MIGCCVSLPGKELTGHSQSHPPSFVVVFCFACYSARPRVPLNAGCFSLGRETKGKQTHRQSITTGGESWGVHNRIWRAFNVSLSGLQSIRNGSINPMEQPGRVVQQKKRERRRGTRNIEAIHKITTFTTFTRWKENKKREIDSLSSSYFLLFFFFFCFFIYFIFLFSYFYFYFFILFLFQTLKDCVFFFLALSRLGLSVSNT